MKNAYTDKAQVDWQALTDVVDNAVHFLDNVIDANRYPLEELREKALKDRRIGLGVMGFAEMLVQLGLAYDSDDAVALAHSVMFHIKDVAVDTSHFLAGERGVYPEYDGSAWQSAATPVRNATLTTVAPTGTISLFAAKSEHAAHRTINDRLEHAYLGMPCSGGIEPKFALAFVRRQAGETMVDVDAQFEYIARSEGWWSDELAKTIAERGSCRGVEGVPERWQRIFATAHDIAPEWHVRMQAAFQGDDTTDVLSQPVDAAVSKTINFAHDATVEDVEKAFNLAWSLGCKGITVYRDGCREGQVLSVGVKSDEATPAQITTLDEYTEICDRLDDDALNELHGNSDDPRQFAKRPTRVYGFTDKLRVPVGDGMTKVYVTLNVDSDGRPYEVFINANDAALSDVAQALGRMVTQMLRYGETGDNVAQACKHLRRGQSSMFSLPSQLARMLERVASEGVEFPHECECGDTPHHVVGIAIGDEDLGGPIDANEAIRVFEKYGLPKVVGQSEKCPSCGATSVVRESGCAKCASCGWSKCG